MSKLGEQIKKRIDFNNQKIVELTDPSSFVLNKEVCALMEENKKLQKGCPHEFVEGHCIYCYKQED